VSLTIKEKNELRLHAQKNPTLKLYDVTVWAREHFGKEVGFSTVSKIVASKIQEVHNPNIRRERRGQYPELEEKLYDFVLKYEEDESSLSDEVLFIQANKLLELSHPNAKLSFSWVQKFKKRFNIKLRKRQSDSSSTDCSNFTVDIKKLATFSSQVVVGTRIHWTNHPRDQAIDVDKVFLQVKAFCDRASMYSTGILIAIGIPSPLQYDDINNNKQNAVFLESFEKLLKRLRKELVDSKVILLPLTFWGKFVPALNAIISSASTNFPIAKYLLLQSFEIQSHTKAIEFLVSKFKDETDLVVGAALPGHDFVPSTNAKELNGCTSPWNTFALWNLSLLGKIGFPLIGDAIGIEPTNAGVEEVSTIALFQSIFPTKTIAKLYRIPGIVWEVEHFQDETRHRWQINKMQSKIQRAEAQMNHLTLPKGKVFHLE
jgi:hypothetical protein